MLSTGHYQGPSGGSWFTAPNWCSGVPDQNADVTLDTIVLVDQPGATAESVMVLDGGELVVGAAGGASIDVAQELTVDSGGSLTIVTEGSVSAPSIVILSGGTLHVTSATAVLVAGDLTIDEGATLDWTAGTIVIDGGIWTNPASTTLSVGCAGEPAAMVVASGGTVLADQIDLCATGEARGDGTLVADVSNEGAVEPGSSAGMLVIDGEYAATSTGTMEMEIGGLLAGVEHDVLSVTGAASMDGLLRGLLIGDFSPVLGNEFTIVSAASVDGQFSSFDLPVLGAGAVWRVSVEADAVRLLVRRPGDTNGDGVVNVIDLLAVLGAWGSCPPGRCPADIDPPPAGDGEVNVVDLLAVLAYWG